LKRQRNVVLCSVCDLGLTNTSMNMRVHGIVPGVYCPGSRQRGRLNDEVDRHRLIDVRWGLLSMPAGIGVRYRWLCNCTQAGMWVETVDEAVLNGGRHIAQVNRRMK